MLSFVCMWQSCMAEGPSRYSVLPGCQGAHAAFPGMYRTGPTDSVCIARSRRLQRSEMGTGQGRGEYCAVSDSFALADCCPARGICRARSPLSAAACVRVVLVSSRADRRSQDAVRVGLGRGEYRGIGFDSLADCCRWKQVAVLAARTHRSAGTREVQEVSQCQPQSGENRMLTR